MIKNIFTFLYQCVILNESSSIVGIPLYPNIEDMLFKTMLRTENFCTRLEMGRKIKDMIILSTNKPEMG